ncbi:hypothetical protein NKI51_27920 [Mesorhizobium australicum]|uniref:hypothetical protein n=1 Tax=Mesorhizobium australicum TaxID=536018 RepID=UPI00333D69B2
MRIVGGAISGYCEIGSLLMPSAPPSITAIAITQAKTGRRMKNSDMSASLARRG